MSTTKGRNLGLRLDTADTQDLEAFEAATGVEATTLARNALRACLAYWKQHGKISFPLRLVEADAAPATPAEPAAEQINHDSASTELTNPEGFRNRIAAVKAKRG